MPEHLDRATERLAGNTSRRGFLARVGRLLFLATAGGAVATAVKPGDSQAYFGFCGHTYTTGNCIHPTSSTTPRIDAHGYPLRPSDGHPIDDLGRLINDRGNPVDGHGRPLLDPDGRPLPPAPRTTICGRTGEAYGFKPHFDGAWYRCCEGHVRKLWDCCAYSSTRINGDAALTGYCYSGRKVFCVQFFQTKVPC
jgi:hypothetical protein